MKYKNLYVELKSQFHRDNHVFFTLSVIGALLSGMLGMAVSWLTGELIDTASGNGRWSLTELLIMSLIIAVFFLGASYLTYAKLTAKNIMSFRSESTSTYLSALTNDCTSIETNYLDKEFWFIFRITSFFTSLALMLCYSPMLTLIAVAVTFLPLLVSLMSGKKLSRQEVMVSERNKSFTATVSDCLNGFSVVKAFRAETPVAGLFSGENTRLENTKYKRSRLQILINTLGQFSSMTAQLTVFIAGAYMALSGKGITAGTVIMFVNLMNFVVAPVAELPGLLASRKASRALIDKIAKSLEESSSTGGEEKLSTLGKAISVKDVSFSYEEGKEVLHDISFDFEAGKSYAIVGASGSGKSTLLNLIMSGACGAEYSGKVSWDDTDLRDASSDSFFDQVASIDQNVFVFNSSIKDNITMFREFPEEEVNEAIRRSNLKELVEERGSDYLCGESGKALSGGEKQRISIARSLLKKSSVLVADEITAALDSQTAHKVTSVILDLTGLTRIVVTHSLEESLMRRYDKILVMRDGRIEEQGTFDELMALKKYFHALFMVKV